jgi:hypothetical protein
MADKIQLLHYGPYEDLPSYDPDCLSVLVIQSLENAIFNNCRCTYDFLDWNTNLFFVRTNLHQRQVILYSNSNTKPHKGNLPVMITNGETSNGPDEIIQYLKKKVI